MLATKLKEAAGNSADATLYVDDVFSTYLYTGNGSTQTITNGIDLAGKGGLVWVKNRTSEASHWLQDTASMPAGNYYMQSNDTSGLIGPFSPATAYNSNGFSFSNSYSNTNQSSQNYASWTFRKAAKFFDVVTYTGDSNNSRMLNHNLGVTPGMIICKRLNSTSNWFTWHKAAAITDSVTGFQLNSTDAPNTTGYNTSADMTATQFKPAAIFDSGYVEPNVSGGTYVAYLFAHDTSSTGIIQCGSFTSDASGNVPNVTLGWEPQYLLYKRSDGGAVNWYVMDSMRGFPVSGNASRLYPNLTAAEQVSSYEPIPTATGLTWLAGSYGANQTYIYMAIRRPNKPPTSGTQVFGLNARTGTGANATVTGGQTDDAVLIKNRGSAVGDLFASRLTGINYLETSSTAAEVVPPNLTILQSNPWDVMDGVKVGTTSTITNASANTFINYFFKRAPGFFDVVCYTGDGSLSRSITTALDIGPSGESFVIIKSRSNAVRWSTTSPLGNKLVLNTNGSNNSYGGWPSAAYNRQLDLYSYSYNNGVDDVNASGQTYVAYIFSTCAGVSKTGYYIGNGTGQAIACGFSAGARFVLIKRADSTGDWYTFDSARGLTSGSSPYLLLNSTAAEVTGNNGVYASTGGFTLGSTASTTTNINGASYIYLSVA